MHKTRLAESIEMSIGTLIALLGMLILREPLHIGSIGNVTGFAFAFWCGALAGIWNRP